MTDIPGNSTTTTTFLGDPLSLATVSGEFESFNDKDWIAITLLAGVQYSFAGSVQSYGPITDDCHLTLYGSDGVTVLADDNDSGVGVNSILKYTPTATATYYISIREHEGYTGEWSLGVTSEFISTSSKTNGDDASTLVGGTAFVAWGRGRDSATDFTHSLGEQGDDTLDGADSGAYLSGGIGNDSITGGSGADRLFGDLGYDYIYGYAGDDTLYGGDGADHLNGSVGNDLVYGGEGADYIFEYSGFDTIFGEGGNDKIYAGDNDDVVRGGAGMDFISGGYGADLVDYKDKFVSVRVTLNGETEATVFVDGVAEDTIVLFENVFGGNAGDRLRGDAVANQLFGHRGKDTLRGGDGNDTLNGGAGNDKLMGGAGFDAFVFNSKIGSGNVDTIFKFEHGVDKILLDSAVMPKLGLTAAQFYKAAGATQGHDASDRIVYNTSNGALYYDKDGLGGQSAVRIAVLDNHPTLTFSDIFIA